MLAHCGNHKASYLATKSCALQVLPLALPRSSCVRPTPWKKNPSEPDKAVQAFSLFRLCECLRPPRAHPQVVSVHSNGELELPQADEARRSSRNLRHAAHCSRHLPAQQLLLLRGGLSGEAGKKGLLLSLLTGLGKDISPLYSDIINYKFDSKPNAVGRGNLGGKYKRTALFGQPKDLRVI